MTCSAYNADDRSPMERAILNAVKANALDYAVYKKWVVGPATIRGWQMHRAKAAIICYGWDYRLARQESLITRKWRLHP
jgi:hypothetical protein